MARYRPLFALILVLLLCAKVNCYEKTLRKIVRNQSKMVQTPFSNDADILRNTSGTRLSRINEELLYPAYTQIKAVIHKLQRPKISTIFSTLETGRAKSTYSNVKLPKNEYTFPNELRQTRNTLNNITLFMQSNGSFFTDENEILHGNNSSIDAISGNYYQLPESKRFAGNDDRDVQTVERKVYSKENTIVIPVSESPPNLSQIIKNIFSPHLTDMKPKLGDVKAKIQTQDVNMNNQDTDIDKVDYLIQEMPGITSMYSHNVTLNPLICTPMQESKADINAQEMFLNFDIEASWTSKKQYWNRLFETRYEALLRNRKWPPLKVFLMPRSHVDSIWKRSFNRYHNDTVNKILSNMVKKLQFYSNLTFTWNEVSHLSEWWKTASQKSRTAFRRLAKGGRLEITTGGWVETDEATTDLFGLVHILIEGHQWLKYHLKYTPKVAWLTNSVAHSSTMTYLLSSCGISNLVITNLHYSWEQYLAEYQISDFIWIQDWQSDKTVMSELNEALQKIGNERFPKHSLLTHYLQFNSAGFAACGPNRDICVNDYNFANTNRNLDINPYNIKEKSEILLEQYSKTGTISPHNVIIAPLGGPYLFELQSEFDYQFNNYQKIAEFVNVNSEIYKATVEFGTPKDYFNNIIEKHKNYVTIKGDFLNFADIKTGRPAYWSGYYTSRPLLKILLRRLQATLRTTEILFSFALSLDAIQRYNSSEIFSLLLKCRENVARLLDRNVVSGTLSANALKYVHKVMVSTTQHCWYIQEVTASLLSTKPKGPKLYLQKYVYRDGEFVSSFKTISPGDQIYIFNSMGHERTEVVEIVTRNPNIRIVDHNKKDVTIQINPMWKYDSQNIIKISKVFFIVLFVIEIPPMTLELFKIKETYDGNNNAAAIYCLQCIVDSEVDRAPLFNFDILPVESGDIQLESYKHRLIFDETSGFLKSVIEKQTNKEKMIMLDYKAFRSSDENAGMFLFNTNVTNPLDNILLPYRLGDKPKLIIISAGQITTEITCIYGRLLQHTVKIFNLINSQLSSAIYVESKVDYEVSPKNRELELFLSIQTDINNGNNPEIYIDNNGFQYTKHILNISRRVESNMYPMTSMVYIQDSKSRFSLITDHAQGVTALQEGQLVVMLDRRILFSDQRGTHEGLSDSSATCHRHFILLEDIRVQNNYYTTLSSSDIKLPSLTAIHLTNTLNNALDIFLIDGKQKNMSYYTFMPLIKTAFPCDVSVVSYRVIINKCATNHDYTSNAALMILHRRVASCLMDNTVVNCNGDSSFSLGKILRNTKAVYKTNLVGTEEDSSMPICNLVNFPPMELITLRVYF